MEGMNRVASQPAITQGSMQSSGGAQLPLERTDVSARVSGPVATVTVKQLFRNPGDDPIEAIYLFPLPHQASVHRMLFRIGDRTVRAVVKEREEARRAYEQARSEGRAATLLEEDKPSLFSLSVANIAPGAQIEVELEYQEVIAFDDGRWRLLFPMVAPERYLDGPAPSAGESLPPPRLPSGERPADVSLEVTFTPTPGRDSLTELESPSHAVEIDELGDGGLRVSLKATGALANRDFLLTWKAGGAGVRPLLRLERKEGARGTFLLVLTPSTEEPATHGGGAESAKALRCGNCGGAVTDLSKIQQIPGLGAVVPCSWCGAVLMPGTEPIVKVSKPRDVILLIDRSASMRGSLHKARQAVKAVIEGLAPGDALQCIAFDHDQETFGDDQPRFGGEAGRFLTLSPELAQEADRFLLALEPRGGTDLERALELTSKLPARDGRTRIVVLITDGAFGNEGRLLRKVPELLGPETRLFVLGLGAAVDRRLVEKLARAGGGAQDILGLGLDAEPVLKRFARRVCEAGPVLIDLSLWWEGAELADIYPRRVPDLFSGEPVQLLGRFSGVGPTTLVVNGATTEGKPFRLELPVELPTQASEAPGLARLWARRHVEALAEGAQEDQSRAAELRAEGLSLSLEHSIVGPFTSLVAEDSEVSVEKERHQAARLVVLRGPETGRVLRLDAERFTVGRHSTCDLVLTDGSVSRLHFEVRLEDGIFVLIDDESRNGTFLGGRQVRRAVLNQGDTIEAGSLELRFELLQGAEGTFDHLPTRRVDVKASRAEAAMDFMEAEASLDEDLMLGSVSSESFGAAEMAAEEPLPPLYSMSKSPMPLGAPPMPAPGAPPAPRRAAAPSGMPRSPAPMPGAPPPQAMAPPPPARMSPPRPPMSPGPAPVAPRAPMPASYGAAASPAPPQRIPAPPAQATIPQSPLTAPGSEPYPERELAWLQDRQRGELDLVFLVDATGSMGPYIEQVCAKLLDLIQALQASPLCRSLRLGLVSYRDHPPEEVSYVTQVLDLTDNVEQVRDATYLLQARGGGDGPEAVTDGLFDVVRLGWRPQATKAVVWFGDAPPHGVEPAGDHWPEGCPCGNHWYAQAEACREMGVIVYAIGCLPGLRSFVGAEEVFRTVARATRGTFLPLREARLLVPMIAGAAEAALDRQRVEEHLVEVVEQYADTLAATDEVERVRWLTEALRARGVRPRDMAQSTNQQAPAPLCFRQTEAADVEGALDRLRLVGRVAL